MRYVEIFLSVFTAITLVFLIAFYFAAQGVQRLAKNPFLPRAA